MITGYVGNFDSSARDVLSSVHVGLNEKYIAFRSGQYTYCVAVGESVTDNGSTLSMSDARVTVYDQHGYSYQTGSGSSWTYSPTVYTLTDDVSVQPGQYLTFTNVRPGYPALSGSMQHSQLLSALGIGIAAILVWQVLAHILEALKRR